MNPRKCLPAAAAILGLMAISTARAQTLAQGRTAADNAAAAGARAPGQMVSAGLAQAQAAADAARGTATITETADTAPRPLNAFVTGAARTLVEQIAEFLLFLGNQMLARQGMQQVLPTDITVPPPPAGGDDTGPLGAFVNTITTGLTTSLLANLPAGPGGTTPAGGTNGTGGTGGTVNPDPTNGNPSLGGGAATNGADDGRTGSGRGGSGRAASKPRSRR